MTEKAGDKEEGQGGVGAVALVADLLFASRIRAVAALTGVKVVTVGSCEALLRAVREKGPRLILIDLDPRIGSGPDLIRELKADAELGRITLIAFGSHLERETLQAAREAGADRVLARSGFVRELPNLLRGTALSG